jgi:hypothetical protein
MCKNLAWGPFKTSSLSTHLVIITLVVLCAAASAQQPTSTPTDPETVKALLQRMQDLEDQVRALKSQVQTLTATAQATPAQPNTQEPAATNAAASAPASVPAHPTEEFNSASQPHPMELNTPRLQLRGFGDVSWNAKDLPGSTNSFTLGQLNLFITSRLTDRASFLTETVIEADSGTNQFGIEPERLMLIYSVNDHLSLSIGRYHTSIGFYNTAYHHSALKQTTMKRPFLFQFEDSGGILPIHNVGVSATGIVSSKLGLHYVAEIGNGRSARTVLGNNPVQNVTDENNGKAFNFALYVRPPGIPGLQFGASGYHDHLSPVVLVGGVPVNAPNVQENIISGHVVYQTNRFEFLNEAVMLQHTPDTGATTDHIPAFYSQISQRFGRYRPYFRYEYMNVPLSDPLYADVGLLHGPRGGLRYSLSESAAFKIEFGREIRRNLPSVNLVGTQLSFAF